MAGARRGCRVAILLAPAGTERVEFTEPGEKLRNAGATVEVVGLRTGQARTMNNDTELSETFTIEKSVSEVSAEDYDALVVPGGTIGANLLRGDAGAVGFVRDFFEQRKPVGTLCHGPLVLVEADVVRGRTLTSCPTLRTDIRNAGGEWIDEEVVTDGRLVTSRGPDNLPAFCDEIVEVFTEGDSGVGAWWASACERHAHVYLFWQ